MIKNLPRRQVHLDFHTSPDIDNVGSMFSPENFKEALKVGNVNSITIFAKCHHGYCYFPTKVGTMHPGLNFDLAGEMVKAAHEIGVRAPVYITAGWSHKDAIDHPEWRAKDKNGNDMLQNIDPNAKPDDKKPHCSWHNLCLNDSAYCRHIYELTEEVCQHFKDLDGLFYDICVVGGVCYCDECRAGMAKMGLNPENDSDARKYYSIKHGNFMRKCGEILHKYHPNATIFFNSGGADFDKPQYHAHQTHFEMEDLPTAWGGYDKMPLRAKFFEQSGKFYLGMTGKFHLDWGEFGGFKTKEALKYETSSMALYGAGCSIGDQLHPCGKMELATYKNIGFAYDHIKKTEEFFYGGESCATLGLYMSPNGYSNEGIANILLENQVDFDVIKDGNFSSYEAVIFPDCACPKDEEISALKEYIKNGGKVIFSGDSLIKDGKFIIDCGLSYQGPAEYDGDFIRTTDDSVIDAPFITYIPGNITSNNGATVLAETMSPYFSRTYKHFCSHRNTPFKLPAETHIAAASFGNIIYIAHKIGEIYKSYGCVYHKRYFMSLLNRIYSSPVSAEIMSQGRCRLIKQPGKNRYCLNMLYCSPVKRGCAEIVDDIVPLYNIPVKIKVAEKAKKVYLALSKSPIEFSQKENMVSFTLPKLECHECVVIEY